jgi:3-methyladenine DNA glycosylase AlkD
MSQSSSSLIEFVQTSLRAAADPAKAVDMQAYMKTDMPFYGVQKPGRASILSSLVGDYPPSNRAEYEAMVLTLWSLPHREEKYLALGYARRFRLHIVPESLALYQKLIVEGAWWDLVDDVATHLIRTLVVAHPIETWSVVDGWVDDPDIWLRRSAIICQVGAKEDTDADRLFDFCARRAFEREFFIRKAIGWALREYARIYPDAVADFVTGHRDRLSGLSYREATKHIGHLL